MCTLSLTAKCLICLNYKSSHFANKHRREQLTYHGNRAALSAYLPLHIHQGRSHTHHNYRLRKICNYWSARWSSRTISLTIRTHSVFWHQLSVSFLCLTTWFMPVLFQHHWDTVMLIFQIKYIFLIFSLMLILVKVLVILLFFDKFFSFLISTLALVILVLQI